jgi:RimJ/RimL family protein N-acetyltransferase
MEAVEESREHLRPWMPFWDQHRSIEQSTAFCAESRDAWAARDHFFAVIEHRANGRYLGGTGFQTIDWTVPRFEIGYWIRRSEEGHGYVTEAVRLLVRVAFDELAANRLEIRCDPKNVRSLRVAERAGFVHEATLRRQARRNDGTLRDTCVLALQREDASADATRPATGAPSGA